MATRLAEPEPWIRVAAVLAEAAGESDSRSFDVEAQAQAKRMRGIRYDWAGKPTCTWSAATELLASLRAEQARLHEEIEERLVAADAARRAALPKGIPAGAIPEGLTGGLLMMMSDPVHAKKRTSVLEDALQNDGAIVFHSIEGASDYHSVGGES